MFFSRRDLWRFAMLLKGLQVREKDIMFCSGGAMALLRLAFCASKGGADIHAQAHLYRGPTRLSFFISIWEPNAAFSLLYVLGSSAAIGRGFGSARLRGKARRAFCKTSYTRIALATSTPCVSSEKLIISFPLHCLLQPRCC